MTDDTTKRAEAWLSEAAAYNSGAITYEAAAIIRALLAERQGWRPISEAPKDRKACLIYVPGNQCSYCVSWDDGDPADPESRRGWHIFGGGWRAQLQDATHYMPLPVPPSSAAGKGVGE